MTTSPLTAAELSHAYTPNTPDDAPSVDGLGNPRFLTELDFPIDTDELAAYSHIERDEIIAERDAEEAAWGAYAGRFHQFN